MLNCTILLFVLALGQNPQTETTEEERVGPTTEEMAGIQAFWRDCLVQEWAGPIRMIESKKESSRRWPGSSRARVGDGSILTSAEIVFGRGNGIVYRYFPPDGPVESGWQGRTHKDAIPADRAWECALPVLKYYDLSTNRDEYEVVIVDHGMMEGKDDLYGAHWAVRRSLAYEGLPCRGSGVQVHLSAISGRVYSVLYDPIVAPRVKHRVNVSKEKAIRKVERWLNLASPLHHGSWKAGGKSLDEVTEVIARPNDPGFHPPLARNLDDKGESYYCWQVPYVCEVQYGEEWIRHLWVRVDNGKVIGGF